MHAYKLEWHAHSVDLQAVEIYVKANFPNCTGNSADSALTFWFTEALSTENQAALEAYWASLDIQSSPAISYVSNEDLKDAFDTLKSGLVSKNWDDMSVAERKIVLGQSLTRSELGF